MFGSEPLLLADLVTGPRLNLGLSAQPTYVTKLSRLQLFKISFIKRHMKLQPTKEELLTQEEPENFQSRDVLYPFNPCWKRGLFYKLFR